MLATIFTETLKTLEKGRWGLNTATLANLLNEFKTHKATTTETKGRKTKVMNYVVNLFNYYFGFYVKNYDKSHLDEKQGCDPKQF